MKYDYKAVEAKWQKVWEDEKTFHAEIDHTKPKFYALVEFPYPSGAGLHVGHPRSYTALDVVSRKRRQNGYNVLYPMGWDAFGLPTENFAMKNHIHPAIVTKSNVDHFRSQLKALGFSFDWDREINTTDPEYYKWTQWIFLQLYKHGLAYKKEMNVNLCTGCKCVLANEEDPLGPLVVLGVGGVDLTIPVKGEAQRLELAAEMVHIALGDDGGVDVVLHGEVLGGQTEGIPAHGVQHIVAVFTALAAYHVQRGVAAGMADVQARTRRIRELHKGIELGFFVVDLNMEGLFVLPHLLPLGFNSLVIILHVCNQLQTLTKIPLLGGVCF